MAHLPLTPERPFVIETEGDGQRVLVRFTVPTGTDFALTDAVAAIRAGFEPGTEWPYAWEHAYVHATDADVWTGLTVVTVCVPPGRQARWPHGLTDDAVVRSVTGGKPVTDEQRTDILRAVHERYAHPERPLMAGGAPRRALFFSTRSPETILPLPFTFTQTPPSAPLVGECFRCGHGTSVDATIGTPCAQERCDGRYIRS